jgi:hypothetical protein
MSYLCLERRVCVDEHAKRLTKKAIGLLCRGPREAAGLRPNSTVDHIIMFVRMTVALLAGSSARSFAAESTAVRSDRAYIPVWTAKQDSLMDFRRLSGVGR